MAGRDIPGAGNRPGPQDDLARARAATAPPDEAGEDSSDTVPVPRITRMPEGFDVVEERMGRAFGQWILEIRCECGRRWFEVEEIETARCPRCDTLVRVRVDQPPVVKAR